MTFLCSMMYDHITTNIDMAQLQIYDMITNKYLTETQINDSPGEVYWQ